jgi:hypothetical protein
LISRGLKFDESVALVTPRKSNLWVAELVSAYFPQFKSRMYCSLGEKDANEFIATITADTKLGAALRGKAIVLYDDGSFSGKQMHDHIFAISRMRDIGLKAIVAVVPFRTGHAEKHIASVGTPLLILSESVRIPALSDLGEALVKPLQRAWTIEVNPATLGLFFFEHKIPNAQSFPEPVVGATVYALDGRPATIPPYHYGKETLRLREQATAALLRAQKTERAASGKLSAAADKTKARSAKTDATEAVRLAEEAERVEQLPVVLERFMPLILPPYKSPRQVLTAAIKKVCQSHTIESIRSIEKVATCVAEHGGDFTRENTVILFDLDDTLVAEERLIEANAASIVRELQGRVSVFGCTARGSKQVDGTVQMLRGKSIHFDVAPVPPGLAPSHCFTSGIFFAPSLGEGGVGDAKAAVVSQYVSSRPEVMHVLFVDDKDANVKAVMAAVTAIPDKRFHGFIFEPARS